MELAAGDQSEAVCQNITISPPNRSLTAEGGSGFFINVEHEANCTFTATTSADWIRITKVETRRSIGCGE